MKRRLESAEEAAARLGTPTLTANERAALWDRIQSTREGWSPRRSRTVVVGAFALTAAVTAGLVLFLKTNPEPAAKPTAVQTPCRLDPLERTLELPASCEAQPVRVGEDEWVLMPGAKVSRADEGARVVAGRVEFRVHRRLQSDFRVQVGAGHQVRVIGTVFQIEQKGPSGSVSVTEGVIEFTWNDGARERVRAGQTLFWPRRPTATPSAALPPPKAAPSASTQKSASPATDLENVMDRVLQLKSQRRHGELIALLERTLAAKDLGPGQRQRLSHELGLALEAAGRSPCDHWKRHAKSYGAGRPGGALAGKLERCKP